MKNEKFIWLFIIAFIFFFFPKTVFAESGYVLPYPSTMPGGMMYKFRLVYDAVSRYWYFGNFGQYNYNLKMADKYLVQAKTLFEYRQYLLGHKALSRSNQHFAKIKKSLEKADDEGKNISVKRTILREAALKHIEILERIDVEVPDVFTWQPEKALATNLYLGRDIKNSINIRKNNL